MILSDSGIQQVSAANSAALSEVRWRNRPENVESIIVRESDMAPIGSFGLGDEIYLGGKAGWVDIDDWFRILSLRFLPNSPGIMELSVRRADRLA